MSLPIDEIRQRCGEWQLTPGWLFWKPTWRRRHWRWIIDHHGCECVFYWQYQNHVLHDARQALPETNRFRYLTDGD